jgi:hypothetical protein
MGSDLKVGLTRDFQIQVFHESVSPGLLSIPLKGQCHEIFCFWFIFMNQFHSSSCSYAKFSVGITSTYILLTLADLHQLAVPDLPLPAPLLPVGRLQRPHLQGDQGCQQDPSFSIQV